MDILAGMIRELQVMIRDGLWRFSGDVFFVFEDVHALTAYLCVDRFYFFFFSF